MHSDEYTIILDIGSLNINLLIGKKGVNSTFVILAEETASYYAFFDKGGFVDRQAFGDEITGLIRGIKVKYGIEKIDCIYVGVPGCFVKVSKDEGYANYAKANGGVPIKLEGGYITQFISHNFRPLPDDSEYVPVCAYAYNFFADDKPCVNPVGKKVKELKSDITGIFVNDLFKNEMDIILKGCGIENICYISTDFAEVYYLLKNKTDNKLRAIINCDYMITTLTIARNNEILYIDSFNTGGGTITAQLTDKYECDFEVLELLKTKINMGIRADELLVKSNGGIPADNQQTKNNVVTPKEDQLFYSFEYKGKIYEFDVEKVNQVVYDFLGDFANIIMENTLSNAKLKYNNIDVEQDLKIYFTGDEICEIRGTVNCFSNRSKMFCSIIHPTVPGYEMPCFSSRISVLATVLDLKNSVNFYIKNEEM